MNQAQRNVMDKSAFIRFPRAQVIAALLLSVAMPLAAQTALPASAEVAAEVGYASAANGPYAVAGAPGAQQNRGRVLVYSCSGQSCSGPEQITEAGLLAGALYGSAVALSGQNLAVGAPGSAGGTVYLYVNNGSSWQLQQAITPADPATGAAFGSSVDLQNDRVVVGAPGASGRAGAVYVFERSAGTWTQSARLSASDAQAGDAMGASVALSGDTVLAGAPTRSGSGAGSFAQGAGYVFVFNGSWAQQAQLIAQFAKNGAQFGYAVDLDGDRALLGAPAAAARSGGAYVFTRTAQTWTQQAQLSSPGSVPGDRFGWSLAIDGDQLLVGAPYALFGCGQVSAFARVGVSWNWQDSMLNAPTLGGLAGWSVALSGTRSVVGVPGFDGAPSHQGVVYWRDSADAVFGGGFEADEQTLCVAPAG